MSMFAVDIVPMADRQYKLIRLDKIKVLNSRNRDKRQFEDQVVKSIGSLGLL